MPGKLDQLLSRVVERKGFRVQGTDAEALFAKKEDASLLVAWKTAAPVTLEEARLFLAALDQLHATSGIVAAPLGVDAQAKDALAANKAVEVWAESRLVIEIGEAMLKEALDEPTMTPFPRAPAPAPAPASRSVKFPSLVAEAATAAQASSSGIAYFMPNKKKEQPPDMQATIAQQRGGSLGYAWGAIAGGSSVTSPGIAQVRNGRNPRLKTDQWGNLLPPEKQAQGQVQGQGQGVAAPAMATPKSIDADAEAYEILPAKKEKGAPTLRAAAAAPACTTLKLNVAKDAALAKTKGGSVKLALVPHVAFEYAVEMSRPGMPAPVSGKGAILVNSLNGDLRTADALDFAPAEPTDCRKDLEKMTAVDVYDKVQAHLTKTFSRTLNVEREVQGNTVMETLKLAPDADEMGLEHRGIVFVPVWEVTSSTGVTKVDAYSGNIL